MARFVSMVVLLGLAAGWGSLALFPQAEPAVAAAPHVWAVGHQEPDEDTISRRDFMRTKLMFSQRLFEGLTTGDFDMIDRSVKEIQSITAASQWVAIDSDPYRKLTEEFNEATRRLAEAAKSRNIDATALRYYNLSTSCIDCHRHLRQASYEF